MTETGRNESRREALWQIERNVRRRRCLLALSQEALAFKTGLHRTQITKIENGGAECGGLTLLKLAEALEVPTNISFAGVESPP